MIRELNLPTGETIKLHEWVTCPRWDTAYLYAHDFSSTCQSLFVRPKSNLSLSSFRDPREEAIYYSVLLEPMLADIPAKCSLAYAQRKARKLFRAVSPQLVCRFYINDRRVHSVPLSAFKPSRSRYMRGLYRLTLPDVWHIPSLARFRIDLAHLKKKPLKLSDGLALRICLDGLETRKDL